jgi:hypothetical protein
VICNKKKQQKDSWGQGEDHYGVLMEDWRLFWAIGSWFCYGFFRFLGFLGARPWKKDGELYIYCNHDSKLHFILKNTIQNSESLQTISFLQNFCKLCLSLKTFL